LVRIKNLKVKYEYYLFFSSRICHDRATGVHYGVTSCEGCKVINFGVYLQYICFLKGFFKRSIGRKLQYTCQYDNNCKITVQTRNSCRACRLNYCIRIGMSIDPIKMGRIPKRVRERVLKKQKRKFK